MKTTRTTRSRLAETDFSRLEFGTVFSDHMVMMDYADGAWCEPEIVPFGPMPLSPALTTLHYAQAVFEGLKAFRRADGSVAVFRPEKHYERWERSCRRLCIPPIPRDVFIGCIRELVALDRDWVPAQRGCSLYIRPFVFATDNYIGLRVSATYRFMVIASPVGMYYKEGLNPVRLITPGEYVRAAKGGLGAAKTPANYAASLLPGEEAKKHGYTQVLWLDGVEQRYVEEVGTMNMFFVIGGDVVTPALEGTILSGVTRDTVLALARGWGMRTVERRVAIDEVMDGAASGLLSEAFGTGTAAVISPVGEIRHGENVAVINGNRIGPVARRMYEEITGIQYGEKPDPAGWCVSV